MRKYLYAVLVECLDESGTKSVANVCWRTGHSNKAGDKVEINLKDGHMLQATFVGVHDTTGGIQTLRVRVNHLETIAILHLRYGFVCVGTDGMPHNWGRLEPLNLANIYSIEIVELSQTLDQIVEALEEPYFDDE